MPNPYFSFKQFTVYQSEVPMKVTTDSCILGAYASHAHPGRVLDIGTGTGLLALMIAQRFPVATIDAVETDPGAINQAAENFSRSPWSGRLNLHPVPIQEFMRNSSPVYDLIISNPPYYERQHKSKDNKVNLARHATRLSITELAHFAAQLLNSQGIFYVILPPEPFLRLERELAINGLYSFDHLSIYNTPDKPLSRVIGGFNRHRNNITYRNLLVKNSKKKYTSAFKSLLDDFYLAF